MNEPTHNKILTLVPPSQSDNVVNVDRETPRKSNDSRPGSRERYTGLSLLRTRPKTYRQILDLLSQNVPEYRIASICRVCRNTIHAVSKRNSEPIEHRKRQLAVRFSDVAAAGVERMAELVGKAGLRDVTMAAGVSADKLLSLTQEQGAGIQLNIQINNEESQRVRAYWERKDAEREQAQARD